MLVGPSFCLFPSFTSTAFDHVTEQGPRSGAESDQRDLTVESFPREGDSRVNVFELVKDVDFGVQDPLLSVLR